MAQIFVLALPPGQPRSGKHRVPVAALAQLPLLLLDDAIIGELISAERKVRLVK